MKSIGLSHKARWWQTKLDWHAGPGGSFMFRTPRLPILQTSPPPPPFPPWSPSLPGFPWHHRSCLLVSEHQGGCEGSRHSVLHRTATWTGRDDWPWWMESGEASFLQFPGWIQTHCLHVPAQIDGEDGRCSRGRASGFRAHLSSGTGLAGPWVVLGRTIWQPAWPLPPTLEPTVTVPARRRVSSPSLLCKAGV